MKKLITATFFAIVANLSYAADVAQSTAKTITFVCEHGVAKSVIAMQLFNKIAKERGLNYSAVSRGIKSESTLHPPTSVGLRGDGFDLSGFSPKDIKASDSDASEMVVLIGIENSPSYIRQEKIRNWAGVPSVGKDYAIARDDMAARIERLISELPK